MSETFQVRVEGMRFDAAHFATFGGDCEPLHGHSYAVSAQVEGSLDADSWVVDFREVKSLLRGICDALDHRFLLQRDSHLLTIEDEDIAWRVETPGGRGYVMPKSDVVALPVDNSTAERLSQWIGGQLWEALRARNAGVTAVVIEVSEGPNQSASFRQERLPLQ
jgi:6-pyruvoyltetrahydropterin/6-carboxytetrahydropterin synthase